MDNVGKRRHGWHLRTRLSHVVCPAHGSTPTYGSESLLMRFRGNPGLAPGRQGGSLWSLSGT
jgi:hypothetical protein